MGDFYVFIAANPATGVFLTLIALFMMALVGNLFVQTLKLLLYHVSVWFRGWPPDATGEQTKEKTKEQE